MDPSKRTLPIRLLVLGITMLLATMWAAPAEACCKYGCCDCSCVAARAAAIAAGMNKSLGRRGLQGSVQSFRLEPSGPGVSGGKWSCVPSSSDAVYCTRQ
jgi:hypothetical protein